MELSVLPMHDQLINYFKKIFLMAEGAHQKLLFSDELIHSWDHAPVHN